jgi:hypothetical protein
MRTRACVCAGALRARMPTVICVAIGRALERRAGDPEDRARPPLSPYYSKFDKSFAVTGSSHNGGGINAHYFNGFNATPGVPADGTNKFLIEDECWRGQDTDPSPCPGSRSLVRVRGDGEGAGSNPAGVTHKWYDNVVATKSYSGPMTP